MVFFEISGPAYLNEYGKALRVELPGVVLGLRRLRLFVLE